MKKLAIGCGIVLVILLVGGAVGTWWVFNRAKSAIQSFTELGKVPDIERQVRNTAAFTPPESSQITSEELAKYLKVQDQVRQTLGERFKVLSDKHKALIERLDKQQHSALDLPELIETYKDLAGLYVKGKQAQADALNANGFSLSEYRWIQQQAYAAIGMPVMNMDVAKAIEDIKAGRSAEQAGPPITVPTGPTGPEANKTLVAPHQKALEDNAALAFFGL